jgi:hypothetical protein
MSTNPPSPAPTSSSIPIFAPTPAPTPALFDEADSAVEDCGNGIDDDRDGLFDLMDDDCRDDLAEFLCPLTSVGLLAAMTLFFFVLAGGRLRRNQRK